MELDNCCNGIEWVIVWNPNKVIDIWEWLFCGGGRLEVVS